jgi:hypothetical protein
MCLFIHIAISTLQKQAFIHDFMNKTQKILILFGSMKYYVYLCRKIREICLNNQQ